MTGSPAMRVLVVDDEPDVVDIMMTALMSGGFAVTPAYDGIQALDLIRQDCPDAMLLDLNMPRKDGWAVLRELREYAAAKPIRIVVLTGSDRSPTARAQVLAAGACAYLAKPCDPEEVVQTLRQVLEAR